MQSTAVLSYPVSQTRPARDAAPVLPGPLLNRLRFLAQSCRTKARIDMAEACRVLGEQTGQAQDKTAELLVRVLGQAFERPMVFHLPGADALSPDEAWLSRVMDRLQARDHSSVAFLMRSRVVPYRRHSLQLVLSALISATD